MESQCLLAAHPLEQNCAFFARLRRRLLILFWVCFAAMVVIAALQVMRSYRPAASAAWHHRRVICSYDAAETTHLTAADYFQPIIRGASRLGCGGLLLRTEDFGRSGRSLMSEAQRYDIRILLELNNTSRGQISQMAVRRYIQGGVSGFSVVAGHREDMMTVVRILQEELEDLPGNDRIVLLPDWLGEELAINRSHFLRTRHIADWKPWQVSERSEVMKTAWEVTTDDSSDLQLFTGVTLPGTIKLSLSQTRPSPSWLRPLLLLRFQNPALFAGWLQPLSDNSTSAVLSQWGCSTLLTAINPSNQSQLFSLLLPPSVASAKLLLSTYKGRAAGNSAEEGARLRPGEAQLLRLKLKEG